MKAPGELSRIVLAKKPEPGRSATGGESPAPAPGLSQQLQADLIRSAASVRRERLADSQGDLGVMLVLYALASEIYADKPSLAGHGMDLRARPHKDAGDHMQEAWVPGFAFRADELLSLKEQSLLEWMRKKDADARFRALRAMPLEERRQLANCCAARLMDMGRPGTSVPIRACDELDIDWAAEFDPGRAVFRRMTAAQLLKAAKELPERDRDLPAWRKLKKAQLVEAVTEGFAACRERDGRSPWIPAEIAGEGE